METPPPAWGRHVTYKTRRSEYRNTPTCVGKTVDFLKTYLSLQKHPHLRGEDVEFLNRQGIEVETPPPAWGRHPIGHRALVDRGNTPTCVGKTYASKFNSRPQEKHPHLRGEDDESNTEPQPAEETPPPAWGRHGVIDECERFLGNTPTCVGKTLRVEPFFVFSWKHPHLRGED